MTFNKKSYLTKSFNLCTNFCRIVIPSLGRILLITFDIFLGKKSGLKLNILTQNGFIYNRIKDDGNHIIWKCALAATKKCSATVITNKMLRTIENKRNVHSHDKSAFEFYKKNIQKF